jgi:hypothetical protein
MSCSDGNAHEEVDWPLIGRTAQDIAFIDECSEKAREGPITFMRGSDHLGEARVHRELEHRSSEIGDVPVRAERSQSLEEFSSL